MCVIVMKEKNKKMISDEIICNSWYTNPHGAGISVATGKTIITKKGLMELDDVFKYLNEISKKYDLNKCAVMLHFRITSKGQTTKEQTHPYPIYNTISKKDLNKTDFNSDVVVSHNGTMPINPITDMNDTQTFILRNQKLVNNYKDFNSKMRMRKATNSKLCFMDKKGNYSLIGSFIKHDNVYYSNSSYEGYVRWYA